MAPPVFTVVISSQSFSGWELREILKNLEKAQKENIFILPHKVIQLDESKIRLFQRHLLPNCYPEEGWSQVKQWGQPLQNRDKTIETEKQILIDIIQFIY